MVKARRKPARCPIPGCNSLLRADANEAGWYNMNCWTCGFGGPEGITKSDAGKALRPLLDEIAAARKPK